MEILSDEVKDVAPFESPNKFTDITGLSLTLPKKRESAGSDKALIFFNAPEPEARPSSNGLHHPGIVFAIQVDEKVVATSSFFSETQEPVAFSPHPITVMAVVPLIDKPQAVQAQCKSIRSECHIKRASLVAIVE